MDAGFRDGVGFGFWFFASGDRGRRDEILCRMGGHALEDVVHEILAILLFLLVVNGFEVVIGTGEIGGETVLHLAERVAGLAHRAFRRARLALREFGRVPILKSSLVSTSEANNKRRANSHSRRRGSRCAMEASKRVVFVSLRGKEDGRQRTRRKRALGCVPIPAVSPEPRASSPRQRAFPSTRLFPNEKVSPTPTDRGASPSPICSYPRGPDTSHARSRTDADHSPPQTRTSST